jgi:predicted lipid-binding transport protein (Tim44 family)
LTAPTTTTKPAAAAAAIQTDDPRPMGGFGGGIHHDISRLSNDGRTTAFVVWI